MIFLKLKHFHFVHVKMFCFDIVFQNSISNTNLSNWKVPENNQIQMNNLKKKLLRVHQNILVNAKWIFFQVLQWDGKLKKKKGCQFEFNSPPAQIFQFGHWTEKSIIYSALRSKLIGAFPVL